MIIWRDVNFLHEILRRKHVKGQNNRKIESENRKNQREVFRRLNLKLTEVFKKGVLFLLINILLFFLVININKSLYGTKNMFIIGISIILVIIFSFLKYPNSKKKLIYYSLIINVFFVFQLLLSLFISINNYIIFLISLYVLLTMFFCLLKVETDSTLDNEGKTENKGHLFTERKDSLKELKEAIKTHESILIDEKWGNGKTFFIRKFMEEYNKDFEFIYIKTPYFSNKLEFRSKVLNEIKLIFRRNGILNTNFKNLTKYFGVEIKGITFKEIEETYDEIIRNVNQDIFKIKKKIILILDDLDRIDSKDHINEILNFVGEINLELDSNFSVITLASKEKLLKLLEINNTTNGENQLDKYFSKELYLKKLNMGDLIYYFSKMYGFEEERVLEEISRTFLEHSTMMKELGYGHSAMGKWDEERKNEFQERATFRNIEKLVKILKEIDLENEYIKEYLKPTIVLKTLQILNPTYWNKIKKIEKFEKEIFSNESIEEIEKRYFKGEVIFKYINNLNERIYLNLKNYEIGEYKDKISYYDRRKNMILSEEQHDDVSYSEYQGVSWIFQFSNSERIKILNTLLLDKKLSQFDVIHLMVLFHINFYLKFKEFKEFKSEIQNERIKVNKENEKLNFLKIFKFINLSCFISTSIDKGKVIEEILNSFFEEKDVKKLENLEKNIYKFYLDNVRNKNLSEEVREIIEYVLSLYKETIEGNHNVSLNNNGIKLKIENFLDNIAIDRELDTIIAVSLKDIILERLKNYTLDKDEKIKIISEVFESKYTSENEYYRKLYEIFKNEG